jgi:hypothetical protein
MASNGVNVTGSFPDHYRRKPRYRSTPGTAHGTSVQVVAARRCELAPAERFAHARGRFSRRLQLDPGLTPPTSWSLPRAGPTIQQRADLVKSPGPGTDLIEDRKICGNLRWSLFVKPLEMGQSRRRSFSQELIYQSRDASRPSSHFRTSLFR